ncbi:hypothetical protein [Paenibacillus odorifer]|uniref:hypothetical protein n=1 Tax=Paenibacillus odorifer TaxID=189426 RepID=UPI0011324DDE|nr:hypothetical protein [Paenibacillus odorifer]
MPKSTRRRREPEVVYEVVPNGVVPEDTFKRDVTMKAMDSLPELLKLAQTFVDMKRDQANVQGQIDHLREQGDYLQKQAVAFVKMEIARRDSRRTEYEGVEQLLKDLYQHLSHGGASSEVQKEIIRLVDHSIQELIKRDQLQPTERESNE